MWFRWLMLVLVSCLVGGDAVWAQAPVIPENPRFTFPTTPEVSVKLSKASTAKPVRGKLMSLTNGEVIIDTGTLSRRDKERGEVGQRIGFDRIESLRSTDGRFQFQPEEDFKLISQRIVAAFASVTIESNLDVPAPTGADLGNATESQDAGPPSESSKPRQPGLNGLGNGGFGGVNNLPKPKKTDPKKSSVPATTESSASTAAGSTESGVKPVAPAPLSGVTETLFCSGCSKEIPTSAIKSGICPHCKIAFANVAYTPSNLHPGPGPGQASTLPAANAGEGAFAAKGTTPVVGTAAPVQGQAVNTGTVVVQGGGFTFDSIPNWAKGGLFVLLVLVGYHLLFNR